jgi:hypothetical protein
MAVAHEAGPPGFDLYRSLAEGAIRCEGGDLEGAHTAVLVCAASILRPSALLSAPGRCSHTRVRRKTPSLPPASANAHSPST